MKRARSLKPKGSRRQVSLHEGNRLAFRAEVRALMHETPSNSDLTDEEKRDCVCRLAFDGDRAKLDAFCKLVKESIPHGTAVVLRGSAVTGKRWKDGSPFDADGPGTSDLDLTLVGDDVVGLFKVTGFFVPGIHSRPLSDADPDIAPELMPLRQQLMEMTGRPVNIQATRDWVMYFRGEMLGQPYLTLIEKEHELDPLRGINVPDEG